MYTKQTTSDIVLLLGDKTVLLFVGFWCQWSVPNVVSRMYTHEGFLKGNIVIQCARHSRFSCWKLECCLTLPSQLYSNSDIFSDGERKEFNNWTGKRSAGVSDHYPGSRV